MIQSNQIIELFRQQPDKYISGEQLSRHLNCSRTAVWKHINGLRQKGYEFEAIPRKGYRLIHQPDRWDAVTLLTGLTTQFLGRSLHLLEQTESTQNVAHQLVAKGAKEGTLVIAEQQSAGRGRMGRKWFSPAGKGIWMSCILKPQIPMQFTPQLTLLVAVAVCRTIRKHCQVDAGIKWPNDILIAGKKVCGILLESIADDERVQYVVAGIGISANLQVEDYPEHLRGIASSLFIESGQVIDRTLFLQELLVEIEHLYTLYREQGFAPIRLLWEALSVSLHRHLQVQTVKGIVAGTSESLDEMGALLIRKDDGELVKVYSGDIQM